MTQVMRMPYNPNVTQVISTGMPSQSQVSFSGSERQQDQLLYNDKRNATPLKTLFRTALVALAGLFVASRLSPLAETSTVPFKDAINGVIDFSQRSMEFVKTLFNKGVEKVRRIVTPVSSVSN